MSQGTHFDGLLRQLDNLMI